LCLGERAGNAALEEVIMALKVRSNYYSHYTAIVTAEIYQTSRLLGRRSTAPSPALKTWRRSLKNNCPPPKAVAGRTAVGFP
jgi:isopropylmalate/homocitrate/citramalate synthase